MTEYFTNLILYIFIFFCTGSFAVIPPVLQHLPALEHLKLNSNRMSHIVGIRHLTLLKTLNLSGNSLRSLPRDFGDLVNLEKLFVLCIKLGVLPASIARLTKLQLLNIGNNGLVAFPPEIGHLVSLNSLRCEYNALSSLPPEIGSLRALTTFILCDNPELHTLPAEMGNLAALTSLDIGHVQLHSLPATMARLTQLKSLTLPESAPIERPLGV